MVSDRERAAAAPVAETAAAREPRLLRPHHYYRGLRGIVSRSLHAGHQGHDLPAFRHFAVESSVHPCSHLDEPADGISASEVLS